MARPSKPYQFNGKEIHGLAHDSDGRWRVVATGYKWTEKNEALALAKFQALTAGKKMRLVPAEIDQRTDEELRAPIALEVEAKVQSSLDDIRADPDNAGREPLRHEVEELRQGYWAARHPELERLRERHQKGPIINESTFWMRVREEFLKSPKTVSLMTGIPAIADIDPNALPKPSVKLTALMDAYDAKRITDKAKYRARREVEKLMRITGATTLADLTQENLVKYRKAIEGEGQGPGTRGGIYGKIKSVIAWGKKIDTPLDSAQIDQALSRCACLRVDEDMPVSRPNPISREHLHTLLKHAVGEYAMWTGMITTALNLCLSIDEMAKLEWRDFDFKRGSYCTIRNKTKRKSVPRAAMLWQETKTLLEAIPRKGPYVFTSRHGTHWTTQALIDYFRDFRRDVCKIPDAPEGESGCTFHGLRDGAFTAAAYRVEDERFAQVLAGHTCGMKDHYVSRHPEITQTACDAVYNFYGPFPSSPAPTISSLNEPSIFREDPKTISKPTVAQSKTRDTHPKTKVD